MSVYVPFFGKKNMLAGYSELQNAQKIGLKKRQWHLEQKD
jgi:hypothetical protein